jgi:LAS superfamily LD-carboxypeptidase LdcB
MYYPLNYAHSIHSSSYSSSGYYADKPSLSPLAKIAIGIGALVVINHLFLEEPDNPSSNGLSPANQNRTTVATQQTTTTVSTATPVIPVSRDDKLQWMTDNGFDHRFGHLNYSAFQLDTSSANAKRVTLADGSNAYLHKDAHAAWTAMVADARSKGVTLQLNDGYRSPADQASIFTRYTRQEGSAANAARVAAPANSSQSWSEHVTGLAIDVNGGGRNRNTGALINPQVHAYLEANAHRFGFERSFSPNNPQDVNARREEHHYRFIGNGSYPSTHAQNTFRQAKKLDEDWEALRTT